MEVDGIHRCSKQDEVWMRVWQEVFIEESNRLKNRHPLVRWVVQTVQAVQRPINVVTESRVREQWRFYYDYDRRGNEVTVSTLSQLSVLIAIIRLCVVAQRKITERYTALFLNHRVNIFIYLQFNKHYYTLCRISYKKIIILILIFYDVYSNFLQINHHIKNILFDHNLNLINCIIILRFN